MSYDYHYFYSIYILIKICYTFARAQENLHTYFSLDTSLHKVMYIYRTFESKIEQTCIIQIRIKLEKTGKTDFEIPDPEHKMDQY